MTTSRENATLPDGWTISGRLAACWTFSDGSTLEYDGHTYWVTDGEGNEIATGSDYRPSPLEHDWKSKLAGLVSFAEHDGESYRYHYMQPNGTHPEDGYSFNEAVAEWSYQLSDELQSLAMDLGAYD